MRMPRPLEQLKQPLSVRDPNRRRPIFSKCEEENREPQEPFSYDESTTGGNGKLGNWLSPECSAAPTPDTPNRQPTLCARPGRHGRLAHTCGGWRQLQNEQGVNHFSGVKLRLSPIFPYGPVAQQNSVWGKVGHVASYSRDSNVTGDDH
jgi:hypothetical protein